MKRNLKRVLAAVLVLLTAATSFSVSSFAENDTLSVKWSCSDEKIIMPYQTLEVKDGLAEKYGFTVNTKDHNGVSVDEATFFDAMIAAHIAYYGSEFTKETAKNYVDISYGYLTKAFGKSASMSGFIINKVVPNDGIIGNYGTFTGYHADSARIKDGDNITFYFYQDTDMYGDFAAWFDKYEYTSSVGTAFTVNLKGYSAMYYGFNSIETILSSFANNIPHADIYIYSEENERVFLSSTDENGNAALKFDKAGTYTLYAEGSFEGDYGSCPLIYPWCTVTVEDMDEPHDITLWQKIVNFFVNVHNKIVTFFTNIFESVFREAK